MKRKLFLALSLTLLVCLFVQMTVSANELGPNLVTGATAESPSNWGDNEDAWGPQNAIDGDMDTRWNAGPDDRDSSWLLIDLGADKVFNHIIVYEHFSRIEAFSVSVSKDNSNWTVIHTGTTINSIEDFVDQGVDSEKPLYEIDFDVLEARYIRLDFTETNNVATLWEVEVYNKGNASLTPVVEAAPVVEAPVEAAPPPPVAVAPAPVVVAPQTSDYTVLFLLGLLVFTAAVILNSKRVKFTK